MKTASGIRWLCSFTRVTLGWVLACGVSVCTAGPASAETSVDELTSLGNEAYDTFDNKKALGYYERAWRMQPDDPALLTRLTWTCNNVGEDLASDESERYFEQAVKAMEYYRNVIELPVADHQDPVFRKEAAARIRKLQ